METRTKLIHISDIHFALDHMSVLDMIRAEGLLSKRILGWINYRFNRAEQFSRTIRDRLSKFLQQTEWDFLVVSGDLTYLSLEAEFEQARQWLEPMIKKGTVLLTPGNHDRYVPKALKPDLFKKYFHDCFPFTETSDDSRGINSIELSSSAVLLEIDMSVPRKLFSSRGRISTDLESCGRMLQQEYSNHCKIVVGHYPAALPPETSDIYLHELSARKKLLKFFNSSQIDIYLHGHIHKTWQISTGGNYPTVHLNSGGCFRYLTGPWAGFHQINLKNRLFEIEKITL